MRKNILLFLLLVFCGITTLWAQGRDREIKVDFDEKYPFVSTRPIKAGKIRNVVLIIGDGMSLNHLYSAWVANHGKLNVENCQAVGLAKTYCCDRLITDSGAAGTALATGYKTRYHAVGVDSSGVPLLSLIDLAKAKKMSTGVVVTCRLNDATPAAFCAHNIDRDQAEELIADYVTCQADFIFGGGRRYFEVRKDGRNILDEMHEEGYQIVNDIDELSVIQEGKVLAVLSDYDLPSPEIRKDALAKGTLKALDVLSKNKKGFFLMVEGSQIDDYGHSNQLKPLMEEILDLDQTIGKVFEWASEHGETLVIVTSDHETGGLTLVGGNLEDGEIIGKFSTGDHSGVMVPVYAFGPKAEIFTGIYENTDIFKKVKQLLKL